jgi:hypothetical protein
MMPPPRLQRPRPGIGDGQLGQAFFKSAHASDAYFAAMPGLFPGCSAIIRFVHPF